MRDVTTILAIVAIESAKLTQSSIDTRPVFFFAVFVHTLHNKAIINTAPSQVKMLHGIVLLINNCARAFFGDRIFYVFYSFVFL